MNETEIRRELNVISERVNECLKEENDCSEIRDRLNELLQEASQHNMKGVVERIQEILERLEENQES